MPAPTPVQIRVTRPYDSEAAFLEGDSWTVDRSDMLLCDAAPLPEGTTVKFSILLTTGAPVVQGEGRIVGTIAPGGGRPGGVRVRFRQLDAPSKGILRRALDLQKQGAKPGLSKATTAEAPPPAMPAPEPAPSPAEPSGVRHRIAGPVVAPGNRDSLLDRLRARTKRETAAE
jgi:hypothetical protein